MARVAVTVQFTNTTGYTVPAGATFIGVCGITSGSAQAFSINGITTLNQKPSVANAGDVFLATSGNVWTLNGFLYS